MTVKTRFAPSPTGDPHIGNMRTTLFTWLFARHNNGKFIVRIEDTDKERYVEGSVEKIKESLDWLGLDYDEGLSSEAPLRAKEESSFAKATEGKGKYGPYIQSERLDIYKKHAQQLLDDEKAYRCFCIPKRLEEMRKEQRARGLAPKYDRKCLKLSEKEIKGLLDKKTPYVVRLKVPEGKTEFEDLIRGKISVENDVIDDQVLLKSDGYPTYHLANVVDDHLMKISHVIRAEEWLPSTPKHILLYKAFGWEIPKFAHLPIILGSDRSKLSKRHGAVAFLEYKKLGYLPEAMMNFLAFLGWNPKTEKEIFSKEELIKEFSLEKVNKSAAIFDIKKLDWIDGNYIRKMDLDELTKKCIPFLEEADFIKKLSTKDWGLRTGEKIDFDYIKKVVTLEQERMKKLSDITEMTEFFFKDIKYDSELLIWKKIDKNKIKKNLEILQGFLNELSEKEFKKEILEEKIKKMIKEKSLQTGEILWPMRVSLTGRKASPGPFEVAEILGKEKVLERLDSAIKKL